MKNGLKKTVLLSLSLGLLASFGTVDTFAASTCKTKIGLVTGTVSQGEDEYQAARQVVRRYGEKCVIHYTYPDNFTQEQETVISNIVSIASTKGVSAIIIGQAVQGSIAAVRKVKRLFKRKKKTPPTFIFWEPHEKPSDAAKAATVIFGNDNLSRGKTIPALAKRMGAKTLIHYSFSRHMSYEPLRLRKDIMAKECKRLGINFVYASAPDPLSEVGITGAQQYVFEDVKRQVKKYGKDTAFFCTNDAMTEPLINRTIHTKSIFTVPDMPSPTMGYPGALGIKISKSAAGNYGKINSLIERSIIRKGGAGRVGGVKVPASVTAIKAMAALAFDTNGDPAVFKHQSLIKKYFEAEAGVKVALSYYPKTTNYHQVLLGNIVYGEAYAKAKARAKSRKKTKRTSKK